MASRSVIGKKLVAWVPRWAGELVPRIPFAFRFGSPYTESRKAIQALKSMPPQAQSGWMLDQLNATVQQSNKIGIYHDRYVQLGLDLSQPITWSDFERIPITSRKDLQAIPLELRSIQEPDRLCLTTGGTSGQPLEFFVDKNAFAREWAHMHSIWETVGYHRMLVKLTLRGKDHGKSPVVYNPVHNELSVNAFAPRASIADFLERDSLTDKIRFIHGYPSAIYEFTHYLKRNNPALLARLRKNLVSIFYGSEDPVAQYRDPVAHDFGTQGLSWYGHSEMGVLAYERSEADRVYVPMPTYGFSEAVSDSDGRMRLIVTSFNNTAGPFIRYDTGDLIEPVEVVQHSGVSVLKSFRIAEGRVGDFVIDRSQNRVSLTAAIFGLHHRLFSWANFVQVSQSVPGEMTIHISVDPALKKSLSDAKNDFDGSGINMDIRFKLREYPIRTSAGKVPLLVASGKSTESGKLE